jgi:hypothetical protein
VVAVHQALQRRVLCRVRTPDLDRAPQSLHISRPSRNIFRPGLLSACCRHSIRFRQPCGSVLRGPPEFRGRGPFSIFTGAVQKLPKPRQEPERAKGDHCLCPAEMHAHVQLPFSTPAEKATAGLAIGAFFFAMPSCEYVHVTGTRRTKPLRLQNLGFFRNNRIMSLDDPDLCLATDLSITFEIQKTDVQNKTVH